MKEGITKKANSGALVRPCSCVNEFQDKTYGRGRRVQNRTSGGFRCTVCGKETTVS